MCPNLGILEDAEQNVKEVSHETLSVELEKKETASGSLASERGEEPRSGKLDNECFLCFRLPPAKKKESRMRLFLWSWRESNPRPNS